jgi:ATP-dependent helicase/DNAse subunit B
LFSYAQRGKNGELRASPVLARLQVSPANDALHAELLPVKARPSPKLEQVDDTFGPAWIGSTRTLSTGALKSQAACPFQSFALHRLRARGEELPDEGFDALQRGRLLHDALAEIWTGAKGLRTSAALQEQIAAGTLEKFVAERVDECMPAAADGWQREYFQIERERLARLIFEWLVKVEAERPPFEVMEAEQEHKEAALLSLRFRVRPDRVDTLVSDEEDTEGPKKLVLLDYKTGRLKTKEWDAPRMNEPQLPFYALFVLKQAPSAIALAGIRNDQEPSLIGQAESRGILPGLKAMRKDTTDYASLLEDWRADLEALAREFIAGQASVAPKYGDETCKYCTLEPLCRVHETTALLDQPEDDDEGAEQYG